MKRICIVSHFATHPTKAGNRARLVSLINEYRSLGHSVHLIYLSGFEEDDITAMRNYMDNELTILHPSSRHSVRSLALRGISYIINLLSKPYSPYKNYLLDGWYPFRYHSKLKGAIHGLRPDVLQVEYVFLSKILRSFPQCIRVIDTHDSHSHRNHLVGQNDWFSTYECQEKLSLQRANFALAITPKESHYFKKLAKRTSCEILTVGHILPSRAPAPASSTGPVRIGFIGSDTVVNQQSLERLLRDVSPLPKNSYSLHVAGEISRSSLLNTTDQNVIKTHQADLQIFYEQIDILYNPTQASTGLKIKNVEALAYGKFVLTSKDGAMGLESCIGDRLFCIETISLREFIRDFNYLPVSTTSHSLDSLMNYWRNQLQRVVN